MEVKINYSQKRARTISAKVVGDTMYVNAPGDISEERLQKIIDRFKIRFEKRKLRQELNKTTETLQETAKWLNRQYFSGRLEINSIEYSTDQDRIFGSCNYRTKTIRISYRLTERARGYLIAKGLESDKEETKDIE